MAKQQHLRRSRRDSMERDTVGVHHKMVTATLPGHQVPYCEDCVQGMGGSIVTATSEDMIVHSRDQEC